MRVVAFEKALTLLPDPARILLVLAYRDGYNADDIAQILACSLRTVRTHLVQARESLALILERLDLL